MRIAAASNGATSMCIADEGLPRRMRASTTMRRRSPRSLNGSTIRVHDVRGQLRPRALRGLPRYGKKITRLPFVKPRSLNLDKRPLILSDFRRSGGRPPRPHGGRRCLVARGVKRLGLAPDIAFRDLSWPRPDTFYITTAIPYANGKPHIGHAYERIATDAIAALHAARRAATCCSSRAWTSTG